MARFFFACLLVFVILVQATVLPGLHLIGVLPDLVLVLLLVWCALRGTAEGVIWVFAAGLLLDVLAMDRLGTNALALLVVAVVAGQAQRRFFHSGMVVPIVLVVIATVVHAMVLLLLRSGEGIALPVGSAFRLIVLQALLDALLVPPLYVLAGWMDRWVVQNHA